jgi:hypothetical protein
MGLRPTRANENHRQCRPRESGDPCSAQWIPAFAGMTSPDVIFRGAKRRISVVGLALTDLEPTAEILRFAQDDRFEILARNSGAGALTPGTRHLKPALIVCRGRRHVRHRHRHAHRPRNCGRHRPLRHVRRRTSPGRRRKVQNHGRLRKSAAR